MKRWIIAFTAMLCINVQANELAGLLADIEQQGQTEAQQNKAREARFLAQKDQQETLLLQSEADLTAAKNKQAELRELFAENQQSIKALKAELKAQSGEYDQVVAVVRQANADLIAQMNESLITPLYPQRLAALKALNAEKSLPSISQLKSLWPVLQQEIIFASQIHKQQVEVVDVNGNAVITEVTALGPFMAAANGEYLQYLSQADALVAHSALPAQVKQAALALENYSGSALLIDPTQGQVLALYKQKPTLVERVNQGSWVGYVILALGVFGLVFALWRLLFLSGLQRQVNSQLKNMDAPKANNPLGRIASVYQRNVNEQSGALEACLEEAILAEVPKLEQGNNLIKLLAAVAPLLGLLGTVTGMIDTFQAITLYGTGDAKLMAGGISQALVTTVFGLLVAVPLLFAHAFVQGRSRALTLVLTQQSAGLMALHIEQQQAEQKVAKSA